MAETTLKTPRKAASKSAKVEAAAKPAAPKKAAAKPTTSKTAAPKPAVVKSKPATVKKTATPAASRQTEKKAPPAKKTILSEEQRYRMIAEAAYYRAESRHFKGDPLRDWIEAERDIAILLSEKE